LDDPAAQTCRETNRVDVAQSPAHPTVKHHLANARSKVGAETTAQLVWNLAPRLPEPEGMAEADEWRSANEVVAQLDSGRHYPDTGQSDSATWGRVGDL
jgi:hypothetical protein